MTTRSEIAIELANFRSSGFTEIGECMVKLFDVLNQIRPTSIDCERTFSTCRIVLVFNRRRLKSAKFHQIIFLGSNIPVLIKIFKENLKIREKESANT